MRPRDAHILLDIVNAGKRVARFLDGVKFDRFQSDDLLQSAVIRQLEIVGEAAAQLTPEGRSAYPDMPWRKIIGMRNILIHAYREVDLREVWQAATVSLPDVVRLLTSQGGAPSKGTDA